MKMLLKGAWTIAMLLLLPGLCRAQSGWTIYGSGETSFLTQPDMYQDLLDQGLGGAFYVGIAFSPSLEVVLGAEYHRMGLREDEFTAMRPANNEQGFEEQIVKVEGGSMSHLGVSLGAKGYMPLKDPFRFYLVAAVGRFRMQRQAIRFFDPWAGEEVPGTQSSGWSGFGAHAGIGLDVLLNRYVKLFVEPGINHMFDDTERSSWGLRLGAGVSPWER